jgi:hypothetical protein
MNGSLFGGLGQGLQNFIQTYTQLHQNELEKKRQAAMDQMNFQSHAATMENQALQRALTQAQLEALPRQQATNEVENILKAQGDQAYNNPNFVSAANRAGMPFQTKQVPLESRNISGTVQGPGLSNIVDKALNMPVNAVKDAAKGSINMGPMQTKKQLAGDMGVAPDTGVELPEEVRVRGAQNRQKEAQANALAGLFNGTGGANLTDEQRQRILVSAIPGLSATEVMGPARGAGTPVMSINPRTHKMEQIGDAPAGAHFVNEPAPRDPLAAELAQQRLADAKEKNQPTDVSGSIRTTISGKQYVDLGDYQTPAERSKAQKAAQAAGVPAVSKEVGSSLAAADTARQNLTAMLSVIQSKLPKDAGGRIIAGPENRISQFFQTDQDLAAFNSWRAGAIQAVQALVERGMGFRLNQAEIKLIMENDMPQITDTVGVAQQRVANVMKLIESKENSALVRDRSTLNPKKPSNITSVEIVK